MEITSNPNIAWFGVSLAVLVIALVVSNRFINRVSKFTGELKDLTTKSSEDIKKIIELELSPNIHLHDGIVSVATRADHIIREAANEKELADRQITFYGAASLSATRDESDIDEQKHDGGDSHAHSPSDVYWKAIKFATRNHVRMRRYISLFTEAQLRDRSKLVQRQYLSWLKRQFQQLQEDENYQLADVLRAPQWGTNMARIITKKTVMEITGNGKAAIVITDEHIAQRIREYARDAVIGKKPKNEAVFYGLTSDVKGKKSIHDFKLYLENVEAICDEKEDAVTHQ